MIVAEKAARWSGSILAYVAEAIITMSAPASDGRPEAGPESVVSTCDPVDDAGLEVGVPPHPSEAREVLDRRGHAGRVHAPYERRRLPRHEIRIGTVAAVQPTDRGVDGRAVPPVRRRRPARGRHRPPTSCRSRPPRRSSPGQFGVDKPPCSYAAGIRRKPRPCRRCTWPPSWSAATQQPDPGRRIGGLARPLDHPGNRLRPRGGVAQQHDTARRRWTAAPSSSASRRPGRGPHPP